MRFRLLLFIMLVARFAAAQVTDTTRRMPVTTVSGVVRDSVAQLPLAGALVQLVAADSVGRLGRTAISDSLGRFTLTDVPAGRYRLGFFHPMLDSLGLETTLREIDVDGLRPVRADLAIPSPARLRLAICGPRSAADSGALVVGIVRDARDRVPIAGVKVEGEWFEWTFRRKEIVRRIPRLVATTAANGWFALCDVPGFGTTGLIASRGADSTGLIEVQASPEGFLRRDLYLGPQRTRDGRLIGVVVAAPGGRPLTGALVSIPDGPETQTDERGEWTLVGAPAGTRMLEIRAVGYFPERIAADVVVGAAPIRTALSTMKSVLDTVKVTASRVNDLEESGFENRRRSGMGRYLTADDVARKNPIVTSDIFSTVPGLSVDRSQMGDAMIRMRGAWGLKCSPAVFIDGLYMGDLSADRIDSWMNPDEIGGMEIYVAPGVPAQFNAAPTGGGGGIRQPCGSIVIWTRPRPASSSHTSWKRRGLKLIGLVALALLVGELVSRR